MFLHKCDLMGYGLKSQLEMICCLQNFIIYEGNIKMASLSVLIKPFFDFDFICFICLICFICFVYIICLICFTCFFCFLCFLWLVCFCLKKKQKITFLCWFHFGIWILSCTINSSEKPYLFLISSMNWTYVFLTRWQGWLDLLQY